jgi:hypothetical protein
MDGLALCLVGAVSDREHAIAVRDRSYTTHICTFTSPKHHKLGMYKNRG